MPACGEAVVLCGLYIHIQFGFFAYLVLEAIAASYSALRLSTETRKSGMPSANFTSQPAQMTPSSFPSLLWSLYLEYLWHYKDNSLVARTAYTFRVLALLISLPFIIFALLDITSYLVARTLGVVDVVKASTSDKSTVHTTDGPPIIHVQASSPDTSLEDSIFSDSGRNSSTDHDLHNMSRTSLVSSSSVDRGNGTGARTPTSFYAGGEESGGNLKLSGVGVFSPLASQPPSPTMSRQQLSPEVKEQLRHRTHHISEEILAD